MPIFSIKNVFHFCDGYKIKNLFQSNTFAQNFLNPVVKYNGEKRLIGWWFDDDFVSKLLQFDFN